MNDGAAIALLKSGDIGGLEFLVCWYQDHAIRIAYPITNDFALAQDVVQEAFIKVYERVSQFDETRPFLPWFLRIVVNDAIKSASSARKVISFDSLGSDESPALASVDIGPEAKTEQQTIYRQLSTALECLSPAHRAVLICKYYLDMTECEIAKLMDCPVGTVKSRLHLARKHLQYQLADLRLEVCCK